jgi:hypothetical protein
VFHCPSITSIRLTSSKIKAAAVHAPDLIFVNTSGKPDSECQGLKPDVGVYHSERMPSRTTDFSKMEFWVEFKLQADHDAFRDEAKSNQTLTLLDDSPQFEHDSQQSRDTRGQIASYAAAHMGTQFRTHVFSLLICGSFARFIRWDRASAFVSERFDYGEDGVLLAEFLRRYNSLKYRGFDVSVSTASSDEASLARTHLTCQAKAFLKLMVPPLLGSGSDSDMTGWKPYLIPSPHYTSRSPFGRATRFFFAYDIDNNKQVFLKDYWRVDEPGMEKEGDIYATLKEHGVRHIAPFDCGGDVSNYHTLAHTLKQEDWGGGEKDIPCYRPYRMVLSTILRDLLSFRSSWEYVNAVADAMEGQIFSLLAVYLYSFLVPSQPTTTHTPMLAFYIVTLVSATSCSVKMEKEFSSIGINLQERITCSHSRGGQDGQSVPTHSSA